MAGADLAGAGGDARAGVAGGERSCVRLSARRRIARTAALGAVGVLVLVVSASRGHTAPEPVGHRGTWRLIFDDEFGGTHLDWFVADGIHLTGAGALGYAQFIRSHLQAGR